MGKVLVTFRSQNSKRLISHDVHTNDYNYKYSFSVDVVPICKVGLESVLQKPWNAVIVNSSKIRYLRTIFHISRQFSDNFLIFSDINIVFVDISMSDIY